MIPKRRSDSLATLLYVLVLWSASISMGCFCGLLYIFAGQGIPGEWTNRFISAYIHAPIVGAFVVGISQAVIASYVMRRVVFRCFGCFRLYWAAQLRSMRLSLLFTISALLLEFIDAKGGPIDFDFIIEWGLILLPVLGVCFLITGTRKGTPFLRTHGSWLPNAVWVHNLCLAAAWTFISVNMVLHAMSVLEW